jgi:hypothetical protein
MCGGCFFKQRQSRQISHYGSLPRVQWCVLNARARRGAHSGPGHGMTRSAQIKNRGNSRK